MSDYRKQLEQLLAQGPPAPRGVDTPGMTMARSAEWSAMVNAYAALVTESPPHEHHWHIVGWHGPGEKTESCSGCGASRRIT